MSEHDGCGVAELHEDDFQNPSLLEDVFQRLIEGLKRRKLVVDLSAVESVMSLGIAVLVAAQGLALIHKTRIAFAAARPGVQRLLELTGADKAIRLYPSVEEAVKDLNGSSRRRASSGRRR